MRPPERLSSEPEAEEVPCSSWPEILDRLEMFPPPSVQYSLDGTGGSFRRESWVFRGLSTSRHELQPSIEREARSKEMPWAALEKLVVADYKAHARMHQPIKVHDSSVDALTWLAVMQHYDVPTRLLDFTYSPFVALYFAVRNRPVREINGLRLWAINAQAINDQFVNVTEQALRKAKRRKGEPIFRTATNHPDDFSTPADELEADLHGFQNRVAESLTASSTYGAHLKKTGCVAAVVPPGFNARLAAQQGAFLVNCVEELCFCESLNRMMKSTPSAWCKRFDIDGELAPEIERRLFQMNIHEQSLFPDLNGLAGMIRQKVRLHWS